MNVKFEKNAYFQAVSSGACSSSPGQIEGEFISQHKTPALQTYKEFYIVDGWIKRKIIAIPAAIYCVLIKSVYHLALSVLTKNKSEKGAYRALARLDREEASGRIASFFSDECGQFFIEQAQFYKTFLHKFLENGHKTLNYESVIKSLAEVRSTKR